MNDINQLSFGGDFYNYLFPTVLKRNFLQSGSDHRTRSPTNRNPLSYPASWPGPARRRPYRLFTCMPDRTQNRKRPEKPVPERPVPTMGPSRSRPSKAGGSE